MASSVRPPSRLPQLRICLLNRLSHLSLVSKQSTLVSGCFLAHHSTHTPVHCQRKSLPTLQPHCPTALFVCVCVYVQFFTSAAEALPCELGPDGKTPVRAVQKPQQEGLASWMQPSKYQQVWANRMAAQKSAKEQ